MATDADAHRSDSNRPSSLSSCQGWRGGSREGDIRHEEEEEEVGGGGGGGGGGRGGGDGGRRQWGGVEREE